MRSVTFVRVQWKLEGQLMVLGNLSAWIRNSIFGGVCIVELHFIHTLVLALHLMVYAVRIDPVIVSTLHLHNEGMRLLCLIDQSVGCWHFSVVIKLVTSRLKQP